MNIWEGHAERYGVFYPMQTFSKQREVDFREVPFFIEAKRPEDTELLKAVAGTLSDKVYEAIRSNAGVFIWQLSLPVTLPTICMLLPPNCWKISFAI